MPGDRDPGAAISSPMTCCCSAIRRYVTTEEGYPGLIVHGPLLGMLQIELARRANADKIPRSFEFRALSPVFAGAAFHIHGRRESNGSITTWAANATGGLAQQGKVVFR